MKSLKFLEDSGVNIKATLEVFGSEDVYNVKLGNFLVDVHTKIKQLVVFMQKGDLTNYRDYVASMYNDAKIYGFEKLAMIAAEQYNHANVGDQYYINTHINDLIAECNNTIIVIQQYLNGTDEKPVVVDSNGRYEQDSDSLRRSGYSSSS